MRFFLLSFFLLSFLNAGTSYELGQKLYIKNACYSCHGNKLEGMNSYPHLANRAQGYLAYRLKRFRDGLADTQAQEMMIVYAKDLSDKDIDSLTIYMYEYVEDKNAEKYDDSFRGEGDGGSWKYLLAH